MWICYRGLTQHWSRIILNLIFLILLALHSVSYSYQLIQCETTIYIIWSVPTWILLLFSQDVCMLWCDQSLNICRYSEYDSPRRLLTLHILAAAQIHICSLYLSTLNKVAAEEWRSITGEWRVGGLNFEIDNEIQNIQRRRLWANYEQSTFSI